MTEVMQRTRFLWRPRALCLYLLTAASILLPHHRAFKTLAPSWNNFDWGFATKENARPIKYPIFYICILEPPQNFRELNSKSDHCANVTFILSHKDLGAGDLLVLGNLSPRPLLISQMTIFNMIIPCRALQCMVGPPICRLNLFICIFSILAYKLFNFWAPRLFLDIHQNFIASSRPRYAIYATRSHPAVFAAVRLLLKLPNAVNSNPTQCAGTQLVSIVLHSYKSPRVLWGKSWPGLEK